MFLMMNRHCKDCFTSYIHVESFSIMWLKQKTSKNIKINDFQLNYVFCWCNYIKNKWFDMKTIQKRFQMFLIMNNHCTYVFRIYICGKVFNSVTKTKKHQITCKTDYFHCKLCFLLMYYANNWWFVIFFWCH